MRTFLISAILALAASAGHAETVRVLSGEHETFSRIVLVFGSAIGWKESRSRDGYEIAFDRSDIALDLSRVFEKIPRTRISDIAFGTPDGVLALTVPCDCDLDIFEVGKNTIALDVRDRAPRTGVGLSSDVREPTLAFPFGAPEAFETRAEATGILLGHALDKSRNRSSGDVATAEDAVRVRDMERALLEQLGRAATQGVARIDRDAAPADFGMPDGDVSGGESSRHIQTRTVFDSVLQPAKDSSGSGGAGTKCYGEEVLDLSQWLSTDDPAEAIALARVGLTSELDKPDARQVENLVRTYLAFGFGAEAKAVLTEFDVAIKERSLYLAMALIVDGLDPETEFGRSGEASCDGPTALWALAARAPGSGPDDINLTSVRSWFVRLPPALRIQLGPRLVETLLATGHSSDARAIRDAIARTTSAPSTALMMVDAQEALESGDYDTALATFSEVVADSESDAPEAMAKLLRGMRLGGRVSAETILDAEALAFEPGGTPAGQSLFEEIVLSWAAAGDFDSSWRNWDELTRQSPGRKSPDSVFSGMFLEMIRQGADGKILRILNSDHSEPLTESLNRETRLALAEWLLDAGQPVRARDILASLGSDNALAVRRLRARLALELGQPAFALSHIAAEDDPQSLSLRGEALSALGDHAAAADLFARAGQSEDSAREAWLLGDVEVVSAFGRPEDGAFLRLIGALPATGDAASDDTADGQQLLSGVPGPVQESSATGVSGVVGAPLGDALTLDSSRNLIEASRTARAAILNLLNTDGDGPGRVLE
ncbi:hypothetical protein [Tropicimonas sp. IMCC6043]|uniref:hypothetical protein n=1 Tax=Tropicimonas sp. IMCC6043 TaxID=2510645 RepID=UPI00101C19F0|nr:hypothetical protein [Tropicimonas sp. IMCC6043]RYH09936.1 hypothetical protein EU800_10315 [Tropicimonas sp. IMCC6043]